jgi:PTS system, fructose-specific, IIB component/PTS system, fructose subfamily, IIA component/PTS system, fructose subfamily, IIC component
MEIKDILMKELVILDLKASNKNAVISEMIGKLAVEKIITDIEGFTNVVLARESQGTTGIGEGIAIPHGKSKLVSKPAIIFARSQQGVDFQSLDGKPANLFFLIATPDNTDDAHLKLLSALSVQLMKADTKEKLLIATKATEVVDIFTEKLGSANMDKQSTSSDDKPFIVAVTGCATGIAHTYMAAEKLQEVAESLGCTIKVETNGSTGVENKLTTTEIEKAVGVIVAADISVEMPRFAGKKVLQVPVAAGISKASELINDIIAGNAAVYKHEGETVTKEQNTQSVGQQIYKHLMSGVSHMLPFVIGGGIAIALAFMVDQIIGVPQDSLGSLGSYNTLANYLMTIGGAAFGFMLPILAGYIAYSIADRPGLVTGFVAGSIAASGGAGFLGALLGGFVGGYIILGLKSLFNGLPKSLAGIKSVLLYPVFGVVLTGAIMLIVNVPMSAINDAMNNFLNGLSGTNAVLLGALLGGMMAVDLGGPINKAAYVFGTGTLAATISIGGSPVMAAVMAGGMVPPLAIFIATLVFKKKFTEDEQNAGLTNLIMGASFITEGAIPFAAGDPLKILPGFIAGSSLAGALVMLLDIKLIAPHGGIFVIPLVSNPLLYILFIILGASVGGFIIGVMRTKVDK